MLLLWVGRNVDTGFLQRVFGIPSLMSSEVKNLHLAISDDPLSKKIHAIIDTVRSQHGPYPPLYLILQVIFIFFIIYVPFINFV